MVEEFDIEHLILGLALILAYMDMEAVIVVVGG
jgi:hypothetical protein